MTEFHLEVYGRTWERFTAVYSYTIDSGSAHALRERKEPFATADATRLAGDFAYLNDWRLLQVDTTYEKTKTPPLLRRIETFKTLRGFRNGMTPKRFYRLANL